MKFAPNFPLPEYGLEQPLPPSILSSEQSSVHARGMLLATIAWFSFSLNDVGIKLLSDQYPLHQIILVRSAVGLLMTLVLFAPMEGGWQVLKTRYPGMQITRGILILLANMLFFMALPSMRLSDVSTLFFIAPLLITAFSVWFLGENVGIRRWCAILVGLTGVVVMMRPGTSAFTLVALLPVMAAAAYASMQMLTRKIGLRDKASAMTFYIQLVFVIFALIFGLIAGDGRYAPDNNPTMQFLLRAWSWPDLFGWSIMLGLGLMTGMGGYMISQAYRTTPANVIAPFEFIALPLSLFWTVVIWQDWPDLFSWVGICLIIGSGIYVFWREVWLQKAAIDTK